MKVMRLRRVAGGVERGNLAASVDVRPHATLGALALGVGATLALATLVIGDDALVGMMGSILVGLTLLVGAALLWYLPSFAKRRLRWRTLASPWPLALGALGLALFSVSDGVDVSAPPRLALALSAAVLVSIGLVGLGVVLIASARGGAPWRGGVPFWRAQGEFRAGDRLAAALLLAGALVLVLAGVAGLLTVFSAFGGFPGAPVDVGEIGLVVGVWGWTSALAMLVMGALVHLLPRSRGQPASIAPAATGAILAALGIAGAPFAMASGALAAAPRGALAIGILLVLLGIHGHAPAAKRPGPRLREARWLLVAAVVAAFSGAIGFFAHPTQRAADLLLGIQVATLLGTGALLVLALPVVFNQRPAGRFLPFAALLPIAAAILARFSLAFGRHKETLATAALVALVAGIVALLAALWPLRRPRRHCPPGAVDAPSAKR